MDVLLVGFCFAQLRNLLPIILEWLVGEIQLVAMDHHTWYILFQCLLEVDHTAKALAVKFAAFGRILLLLDR